MPSYSKAPRGLSVLLQVTGIFTGITTSPGLRPRQLPNHFTIRAGRNLPDKEFRYLRTILQSSLARVILSALSFSLCPPVSVYSTGTASLNRSFSRQCRICDLCPLDTSPSGLTFKHADLPTCPRYSLRKAIPSAFSHTSLRHSISQTIAAVQEY